MTRASNRRKFPWAAALAFIAQGGVFLFVMGQESRGIKDGLQQLQKEMARVESATSGIPAMRTAIDVMAAKNEGLVLRIERLER